MSVDYPPPDSNMSAPPGESLELEALRREVQQVRAPDHLRATLVARFEAEHATQTAAPERASRLGAWPWRTDALAWAACTVAGIALGITLLNGISQQGGSLPAEGPSLTAIEATPELPIGASARSTSSLPRGTEPAAIRLSPTGPIYTRIAVPVHTHSLSAGPGLRYVNTLTYQNSNRLTRAVFVRNGAAPGQ